MKKICILSMQRVNNFGSLLQSYSLKKELENLGNKVSFIDIKPNDEDNKLLKKRIKSKEEKNAKKSKLSKIDKYAFNRIFIKIKAQKQNKEFEEFRKEYLKISSDDNNKEYDVCVIGSDEVFNCASTSPWGFTSQLFGNVENANQVITYAASCGATKYSNLSNEVIKKIKESFENVRAFSVRDKNTYEFVSKMSEKEININLDPVLIENFDKEIQLNSNVRLPEKFCIVYSYYNRFNSKEEIKQIKQFCKKNNMTIVAIGAPQYWIKKYLVMNPFQMLYTFSKAEFIITDTFHGTIFASKYSKKFATIIRDSNRNKLSDLLIRLNIENHLANDIYDIEKIYKFTNNIELNQKNNLLEKEKSIEYLKKNIV